MTWPNSIAPDHTGFTIVEPHCNIGKPWSLSKLTVDSNLVSDTMDKGISPGCILTY